MLCLVAAVLSVLALSGSSNAELAVEFEKCHFNDAACSTSVANLLLKNYGKTGVRSINLLPFDPLHVNSIKLPKNPNSPVSVEFVFNNVDIYGLSAAQGVSVSGFTRDVKDNIVLKGKIPEIKIVGPYTLAGNVLGLAINGKGDGEVILKNVDMTATISAKLNKKGNDDFLDVHDGKLEISQPENVHFQFGGLFDGNKELGDSTNEFLNGNWREIFGEMRPGLTKAFALITKHVIKSVFDKYPYTDFFLE